MRHKHTCCLLGLQLGLACFTLALCSAAEGEPNMTESVQYGVGDIESKVIAAKPGRYIARCAVVEVPSDPQVWILFYHEASHHWKCTDGVMHIRFSKDYGESWSAEDTYLDGSRVPAFPGWPPGAEPESVNLPCEPWAYRAPNGDVVLQTLNRRFQPTVFNGTW
jgi:hypothetical protein